MAALEAAHFQNDIRDRAIFRLWQVQIDVDCCDNLWNDVEKECKTADLLVQRQKHNPEKSGNSGSAYPATNCEIQFTNCEQVTAIARQLIGTNSEIINRQIEPEIEL